MQTIAIVAACFGIVSPLVTALVWLVWKMAVMMAALKAIVTKMDAVEAHETAIAVHEVRIIALESNHRSRA